MLASPTKISLFRFARDMHYIDNELTIKVVDRTNTAIMARRKAWYATAPANRKRGRAPKKPERRGKCSLSPRRSAENRRDLFGCPDVHRFSGSLAEPLANGGAI